MKKNLWTTYVAAALSASCLSGCATLPQAGPSSASMRAADSVDVVRVTPQMAAEMSTQSEGLAQQRVTDNMSALRLQNPLPPFRLAPGDTLKLALWSYAGLSAGGASSAGGQSGVTSSDLGTYTLSAQGTIDLPFVGQVMLADRSIEQAQADISHRFAALHTLARPSAVITLESAPHSGILVSGAIGAPKLVPWVPGGISLAQAITAAMGNGASMTLAATGTSNLTPSQSAEILRDGQNAVELPLTTALESSLRLRPGDRVILKSQPSLKVTVLGGGVSKPSVYGFGDATTLAQALAQASGLNSATADTHGVYILRQMGGSNKPVLYDFAWSRVDGLISAQRFPLHDGDMIYVSEAPFTEVSKVLSAVYTLAVPVQIAR